MKTTQSQGKLLSKFHSLRSAAFGLGGTVGADFARDAATEWKARQFAGLASACFNLTVALQNVPGSYDIYARARDLAAACGREAHVEKTLADVEAYLDSTVA